jgi:hypothetical protein
MSTYSGSVGQQQVAVAQRMPRASQSREKRRDLDAHATPSSSAAKRGFGLRLAWWQGGEASVPGSYSVAEHTPHDLHGAGKRCGNLEQTHAPPSIVEFCHGRLRASASGSSRCLSEPIECIEIADERACSKFALLAAAHKHQRDAIGIDTCLSRVRRNRGRAQRVNRAFKARRQRGAHRPEVETLFAVSPFLHRAPLRGTPGRRLQPMVSRARARRRPAGDAPAPMRAENAQSSAQRSQTRG